MRTAWFLARLELLRHKIRWAVIGVAIVLASVVVIATLGGARRTSSVYERFRVHNRVTTTGVIIAGLTPAQIATIRALPQIEAAAVVYRFPGRIAVGRGLGSQEIVLLAGPRIGVDVNRFTYIAGRAPQRADEISIDALTADETGLTPGDRVSFAPYDTAGAAAGVTPPTGAPEPLRVTGVVATADKLARLPGNLTGYTAPGFRGGSPRGASFQTLEVRLQNEPAAFDHFQDALTALRRADPSLPAGVAAVGDSGDTESRVQTALDALAVALLIIAVAVFLEGVVLLATVLARTWGLQAEASRRLAAMGATRAQRAGGLALPAAVVGVPAVVLGAAVAWIGSNAFPVSTARQLETTPGRTVDWVATLGGILLLVVSVLAIAVFTAWRATRLDAVPRVGAQVSHPRRAWLPLGSPADTGTRFAFDRRGARTPIRVASAGLIAGIAGVAALLVITGTLQRVETTPARYGWNWDVAVRGALAERDLSRIGVSDDVNAAAVVRGSIADLPFGATWTFDVTPVRGSIEFTTLQGRIPIGPGELAAGPVWLRDHGLHVGDVVPARNGAHAMTVVGKALVPAFDDDAIGGTVIVHGLPPSPYGQPVVRTVLRLALGASRPAVLERLERSLPPGSVDARTVPLVPVEVRNLTRTNDMQRTLAALLALSAVAALAHLLTTTIRRRRKEIATLRTLGYTPRQAGFALVWAGLSATAVGVVIGAPIGVAIGFAIWRFLAASVGIASDPIVTWTMLAGLLGVSLLAAALISWWPARRASRLRPGQVLRGE